MEKKTKIICLHGGPGTGKSTSAAYLYYLFKSKGVNSELVREYVKDWAWEGRQIKAYDQIYFLGKQIRRETLLYGKTDWIITDSPVLLGVHYAEKFAPPAIAHAVRESVLSFYQQTKSDGYQHIHVFLKRSKPYEPAGRYQTLEQAQEIDLGIKALLDSCKIGYFTCGTEEKDLKQLFDLVTDAYDDV